MGIEKIRTELKNDHTINQSRRYAVRATRALPRATLNYFIEKVPAAGWLPKYNPRWLFNDIIAGFTVGALLIPQSLAYAKIATIPGQYGLMASWIPGLLYFLMGTSKDLSTGPTSLIGLLTAEVIEGVGEESGYSVQAIAAAVALMMGVYSAIIGLLKLGFVLDFVSAPVLTGFVSAAAIVIMLGQIPSLFGGMKVGTGTATILHDFFTQLNKAQPATILIGFTGIILLVAMQYAGKKFGKKNKVIWVISIGRSAIVLILFTGISYALNKDLDDPLFELSKVKSDGISAPQVPDFNLVQTVAGPAIAPFIAAALEHLAIAKGFARKNKYVIDVSQELVYLGSTNIFNSFFSAMGVGGAMSRTAVNSESGVKSPLYGLISSAFVILSIYKLSPALFWIPKATLAAIIVTAVWHIIGPVSLFYKYWKTSLPDFIASMLAFWVTLFVSTEMGIGIAVIFNIVYVLLRTAFAPVPMQDPLQLQRGADDVVLDTIPDDIKVFRFDEAINFSNAYRVKTLVLDKVQTYNSGSAAAIQESLENRNWSVSGEKKIRRLRAQARVRDAPPPIHAVILDMSNVTYIDTTGILALADLKTELRTYAGATCDLRFVNMSPSLQSRFERAEWQFIEARRLRDGQAAEGVDIIYDSTVSAINQSRINSKVAASSKEAEYARTTVRQREPRFDPEIAEVQYNEKV